MKLKKNHRKKDTLKKCALKNKQKNPNNNYAFCKHILLTRYIDDTK